MFGPEGVSLSTLRRVATQLHVARLRALTLLGPSMPNRKAVLRDVEKVLKDLADCGPGLPQALPLRVRALLLAPRHTLSSETTDEALGAYIEGLAHGAPIARLADLVIGTASPELMGRFLQLVDSPEVSGVRSARDVALVMTA